MHLSLASFLALATTLLIFTALFGPATSLPDRTAVEVDSEMFGLADLDVFGDDEEVVDQDEEFGGRSLEDADERMYAGIKAGLMKQKQVSAKQLNIK